MEKLKMKINKYLNSENLILVFIFALGFYLRICNINHGLPYIYNHDGQNIVEQALRYGRGILRPFGFTHGSFFPYILFIEYIVYFLLSVIFAKMSHPLDLLRQYILDPSLFFILARLTVVFFSMGILFIIYKVCKEFFDKKTGLFAVLFTSVSFYMVYMSHLVKEDIVVTFFILSSFYFLLKALKYKPYLMPLYISSLLIGIAISVKYYASIGLSFIFLGLFFKMRHEEMSIIRFLKISFICLALAMGTFLFFNPYVLIDYNKFIYDMLVLKGVYSVSYGLSSSLSWLWLFIVFLKEGIGIYILCLFTASLFFIFFNRNMLLCNIYPLMLYIFLCIFKGTMPYFLVSVIPFVSISSAFLISSLSSFLMSKKEYRFYKGAVIFTAIAFSLPSFIVSWKYCRLLDGEDTRLLAKRWIEKNIERDSSIIIDGAFTFNITGGGPPLLENMHTLKRELEEINRMGGSGFLWKNKIRYINARKAPSYELYKTMGISPEDIKRYNPEYVILSDYYKPSGHSLSVLTKDYLKQNYINIKKIRPDIYINFFPSFESLYFDAFKTIDKINFMSLDRLNSYGPAIEIYEKAR